MQRQDGRRTLRTRKVSQAMAVVDESSRLQATQARLDALENDNDAGEALAPDSDDDEVVLESEGDDDDEGGGSSKKSKKGKKAVGGKRKTRGSAAAPRGLKSFTRLLEDSIMDRGGTGGGQSTGPSYLSAAAGPPAIKAPRKFCSVCGNESNYTCTRCRSRYCSRKCYGVHTETRCLKFTL